MRDSFGLSEVVLVGDRGMLTSARIERLREFGGIGWVSALRAPSIKNLVEEGTLGLSLFDERNPVEISSPDFPDERLVVCRNPVLAAERARRREELLLATEADLARIGASVARGSLRDAAAIGLRVGQVRDRHRMAKHFEIAITDGSLAYHRRADAIAQKAALDGLYVIRTSVAPERLDAPGVVLTYKRLSGVERDFRGLWTSELRVRPIHHWREDRVRGHLFLCLLAAYVRWHLERAWAPLLFRDEAPPERTDAVAPPERSAAAHAKDALHRTPDDLPVHSLRTLLAELGTLTRNRVLLAGADERAAFEIPAEATPLQARALSWRARHPWPSSQSQTARSGRSVLDLGLAALEVRDSSALSRRRPAQRGRAYTSHRYGGQLTVKRRTERVFEMSYGNAHHPDRRRTRPRLGGDGAAVAG